ncbi:MAG: ribosomal L7Ae/L30e/S12e/Gadd45 family protein [Eubacteriales bacterium]|nr:ribosomal L7Ae/L30e/S12e/Gadd45 family protein [Bacillota bacterium]MBV1727154.1 ribosomal L7Ae/L30e/S12e/Gadd45 family protein [Desulforudis sp.]MDP3050378.1 ribosomal L7Ae/L30e/S12e/Gadd45 family protein [Eubacteriales bacterium]MDQ7789533.1 ribosomal L7Ae/L30e/S12e/Gadd45 family protein [Clostridia bacterium]MBU4534096.1 ribosomal L7Ae/L30e/S12e/Gadd45 family protein [Bacillota bacterium]
MPFERLNMAQEKTVGSKQTLKAIQRGQARMVYVALDAEPSVLDPIVQACRARAVPLIEVSSMQELGKACGISVGCASAAITKE